MYKAGFYASKVYRILCLSIPLVAVYWKIMMGAAGHNAEFHLEDWALIVYSILTPALFYLYESIEERVRGFGFIISCMVIALVLAGLLIIAWNMLDALFSNWGGVQDNLLVSTLTLTIPIIISVLVLFRLFHDQKPETQTPE